MDETQLSSWRPRRPSAGLRRRIFGLGNDSRAAVRWFLGALAPTTACLAMTVLMLNSGNDLIRREPTKTVILSSPSPAAFVGADAEAGQNRVSGVTFDWTNHASFQSSVGFAPTTNLSN